jgi:hypothetical protein
LGFLVCRYTLGGDVRLDGLIRGLLERLFLCNLSAFFYNPQHPIIFFDFLDYGLDNADNSLDKVDKSLDYDDFLLCRFAFFLFAV